MANLHVRSNSLPSKSHSVTNDVEHHLCRLKSSEGASVSAPSVCENLASLVDLHEGINNLIQMKSTHQALSAQRAEKWVSELLDESLGLVDLCALARDVLSLSMCSIQEHQSTIRRNRAETATEDGINAYMISSKKIQKMVNKSLKNLKSFNNKSIPSLGRDSDLGAVLQLVKETMDFDFSILKCVLMFLSSKEGSPKKRTWSLFSMLTQTSHVKRMDAADVQNFLKQLKSSEEAIQEIDKELEAYYRTLVKTRVSLLNALSH